MLLLVIAALQSVPATSGSPAALQRAPSEIANPEQISDDIVVRGLHDIDRPDSPVSRETLGSGRTGDGPTHSRTTFALAERFARCAIRDTSANRKALRLALDSTINSARQSFAQQQFVRMNAWCAQDPSLASMNGVSTFSHFYDTSYYERGALYVEAINRYQPRLSLTTTETGDSVVQARFNAREGPLSRFRQAADKRYFEIAICLVRLQPELSMKLVRTSRPVDAVNRLEAAIVDRARVCTGNARRVYFDAMQFRFSASILPMRFTVGRWPQKAWIA